MLASGFQGYTQLDEAPKLMTPQNLEAWMTRMHFNKVRASEALGIARTTLDRYLEGNKPIPRLVTLACAALSYGLPEHP